MIDPNEILPDRSYFTGNAFRKSSKTDFPFLENFQKFRELSRDSTDEFDKLEGQLDEFKKIDHGVSFEMKY